MFLQTDGGEGTKGKIARSASGSGWRLSIRDEGLASECERAGGMRGQRSDNPRAEERWCTAAAKNYFGSLEKSQPGDVPGPWGLPEHRVWRQQR